MKNVVTGKDIELKDTIVSMVSKDYKERFKAEYWQLNIRIDKLSKMLDKYENGQLEFKPTTPIPLLFFQLGYMISYKNILEQRAIIEQIELGDME